MRLITKRLIVPTSIAVFIVLSMFGMGLFMLIYTRNSTYDGMPKLKDFQINAITDMQIVNNDYYYSSLLDQQSFSGDSSGVSKERLRKYDRENVKYSVEKITGINTVSATKVENSTVTFYIDSKLYSGEMMLVVIMDNEIIDRLDVNDSVMLSYDVEGEHLYLIKMICKNAKVEINISRHIEIATSKKVDYCHLNK